MDSTLPCAIEWTPPNPPPLPPQKAIPYSDQCQPWSGPFFECIPPSCAIEWTPPYPLQRTESAMEWTLLLMHSTLPPVLLSGLHPTSYSEQVSHRVDPLINALHPTPMLLSGLHPTNCARVVKYVSFITLWHKHCSNIKIQPARSDLCDKCDQMLVMLRHSLFDEQRKMTNTPSTSLRQRHFVMPTMQTLRRLRRNGERSDRRSMTRSWVTWNPGP